MQKTASDIQAELEAALAAEDADATTHAAAISQAVADLAALAAAPENQADPIVSLTGTTASGSSVTFLPQGA